MLLFALTELINTAFRERGFITDTRPPKLHVTLMKTSQRKPKPKRPIPFSYPAVLKALQLEPTVSLVGESDTHVPVQWGRVQIHRIQLCKMNSKDGRYIVAGGIDI